MPSRVAQKIQKNANCLLPWYRRCDTFSIRMRPDLVRKETILARVTEAEKKAVDAAVEAGPYRSVGEFVRAAIEEKLGKARPPKNSTVPTFEVAKRRGRPAKNALAAAMDSVGKPPVELQSKKKRVFSAATKRKMAMAQKARWAAVAAGKKNGKKS